MGIEEYADMLSQTVTIEPFLSLNNYGERSFGAPTNYKARVVESEERVVVPGGEEIIARGRVILGSLSNVQPEDRITLPDGSKPQILAVRRFPDENGDHHEAVIFK